MDREAWWAIEEPSGLHVRSVAKSQTRLKRFGARAKEIKYLN